MLRRLTATIGRISTYTPTSYDMLRRLTTSYNAYRLHTTSTYVKQLFEMRHVLPYVVLSQSRFVVDVIPSRSRASRCSRTSPLDTKSGHCKFFFGVRSSVDPASVRPAKDRLDSTQSIQENNRECCGKTLLFIKSWNRFHFLDVPCTLASCSSVIAPSWR